MTSDGGQFRKPSPYQMHYSAALLIDRLSQIAAENERDARRAANPEIVAARAAVNAAREAYEARCAANDAARALEAAEAVYSKAAEAANAANNNAAAR